MAFLPHHELELRFIFRPHNEGAIMDNNTIHELRRGLAETLEVSEFGEVIEWGTTAFENRWAVPAIDAFVLATNELHISYLFLYPLIEGHGNLTRLTTEIQNLHDFADRCNVDLIFSITTF